MKINAINLAAMKNLKRKNYLSNPQNKPNATLKNSKLDNSQNVSFGIIEWAFIGECVLTILESLGYAVAFIAGSSLLIGGIMGLIGWIYNKNYDSGVGTYAKQQEEEKVKESREEQIKQIQKKFNVSYKEAERYHDEFLSVAYIKPSEDGIEHGINAIMGYGNEKYNLAINFLVPIISAQKTKNKKAQKLVPDGLLLYGPGGSGKTYMAEHLSEHLREFGVDYKEFKFKIGQHEKNAMRIRKLFNDAEKQFKETGKYTVIRFVEDIDKKFMDTNINTTYLEETAAFIASADNCASKGAIWIATANNPKQIELPVLRRASIRMPIGNMQDFQIGDMLKYVTLGIDGKEIANNVDYQKVVDHIRKIGLNFTPDEYKKIVQTAKSNRRKINAETIIQEIDDWVDSGLYTLTDKNKEKFKYDQDYVERINKEKNDGKNN